ncbi:isochorismatase family protein [Amycolatopsis sp. EV170708-02-1]|uniref:isochorismatase family protein n=1 Tax=Amycolatopsis sp. EV170708-02-1 TaxID=2919322 RepID=UPI0028F43A75|nr:isochorismatase family protein [Amycolatopsis sp. EV170708-02-1]
MSWRADPARSVLLILDMQRYFTDAFTSAASLLTEVTDNIDALRRQAHESGIPVVYTAHPGDQRPAERGLLADFWGPGLRDSPEDTAIISALAPRPEDIVLPKHRYSAFHHTELANLLDEAGRDQIIVTGLHAHLGCLMTVQDAFSRDIQAFLAGDAVADFSSGHHVMAVEYVAARCGAVVTTAELAKDLTGGPAGLDAFRARIAEIAAVPVAELRDDTRIDDLGLDSIRVMTLVDRWNDEGIEITFADLAEAPTLADWWPLLVTGTKGSVR